MPKLLTLTASTLCPTIRRAGGLRDPIARTTYFFKTFGESLALLGRARYCDVPVEHPTVSEKHATLKSMRDGRVILRDHESRNGTYVNLLRIDGPIELVAGMTIHLGSGALLLTTDERGNLPITGYTLQAYCYYAVEYYGSDSEAARRIGKSRKFVTKHANKWRQLLREQSFRSRATP